VGRPTRSALPSRPTRPRRSDQTSHRPESGSLLRARLSVGGCALSASTGGGWPSPRWPRPVSPRTGVAYQDRVAGNWRESAENGSAGGSAHRGQRAHPDHPSAATSVGCSASDRTVKASLALAYGLAPLGRRRMHVRVKFVDGRRDARDTAGHPFEGQPHSGFRRAKCPHLVDIREGQAA
jgi:hypothetical protein